MAQELQELLVPGPADWRAWLEEHHARSPGVWLVLGRKGRSLTTMTWSTAVDEALCFGWIDGQGAKRDDVSSLQRMTPRGPRSMWSARNVANVARLEQEGRMRPAGQASGRGCFHGAPDLDAWLRAQDLDGIVLAGITTNHCCETTARVGGNLRHQVLFVLDATHAFDRTSPDGQVVSADDLARVTATNLHGEFATVVATHQLLLPA